MSTEIVPIQRTNSSSSSFDAFNIAPGQDTNIRWLSRPNQQLVQQKYSNGAEKFRITFDAENFQPEQIKIYIQNHQLTISGVYEERSEGRFMQKQFERSFDIPSNADVSSMASYITTNHMLVVEIPLGSTPHIDHLSIDNTQNNQRRLSFSLNKYNTTNNQGLLSTPHDLPTGGQGIRRTSVTKTTTTTTSTGSQGIPPEAAELLRNIETTTAGNSTQTYTTRTTERRSSGTNIEPQHTHTTLTTSDLSNLPIEIPSELLTTGGTITIQKRKVSISRTSDHTDLPVTQTNKTTTTTTTTTENTNEVPIQRTNNTQTNITTTKTSENTNEVPIQRVNNTQTGETTINRTNNTDSTLHTTERRNSKTSTSTNSSSVFTLEEFLQNKTWNPSLIDGADGKKILYMRLQMKSGTKSDQIKTSLNGHDFRVEVDNIVTTEGGLQATEHSFRQVTLFSTCEINHLTSELKDDGYLHIKVPINL